MSKKFNLIIGLALLISFSLISAISVENVQSTKFMPGESGQITVVLKNNLKDDATSVSFILNLKETQFTTQGSSEESVDEIQEDDKENFRFTLKIPAGTKPGDYNIPYTLSYNYDDKLVTKTGSFGINIGAKTELDYTLEANKNVINEKDKLVLKIINLGLGDVRFVSVKVEGIGMEILSSKEEYVGTVASDDFETVNFDVLYKSENAKLKGYIRYKDLDNKEINQTIEIPIKVYSRNEGLANGKITKSNNWIYLILLIFVILLWIIYKKIKKNKKRNENLNGR